MTSIVDEVKKEIKDKHNKEKQMKNEKKLTAAKSFWTKAYNIALTTICEAVLAAFAIIGVMSLIHTESHVQTILAVFFVALLVIVKSSKK